MRRTFEITAIAMWALVFAAGAACAQSSRPALISSKPAPPPPPAPDANYIVGVDDVLTVTVYKEPTFSGDVTVRPDGKITPPGVGNDIAAAGLTVEQLKEKIVEQLKKYFDSPDVSVGVKTILSRKVYISGSVAKPGVYPLTGPMTVDQLIAAAGGLLEFADKKNIMLISGSQKAKDGSPLSYKINFEDLMNGKNLARNNIELRPGDRVIVK